LDRAAPARRRARQRARRPAARLEQGQSLGAINLGTGIGISVREVMDAARRALGHDIPHTIGPRRPGDPPRLIADPALAGQLLGWIAQRSDLATIVDDALRSRRDRAAGQPDEACRS
jgi:UDP-glucose 4-epimerase